MVFLMCACSTKYNPNPQPYQEKQGGNCGDKKPFGLRPAFGSSLVQCVLHELVGGGYLRGCVPGAHTGVGIAVLAWFGWKDVDRHFMRVLKPPTRPKPRRVVEYPGGG